VRNDVLHRRGIEGGTIKDNNASIDMSAVPVCDSPKRPSCTVSWQCLCFDETNDLNAVKYCIVSSADMHAYALSSGKFNDVRQLPSVLSC